MTNFPTLTAVRSTPEAAPLIEEYQEWMQAQSWAERTIGARLALVARLSTQAGCAPQDVTKRQVLAFLSKSPSASSRQTYHVDLNSWFRFLVEAEHRDDHPLDAMKIPRAARKLPRPLSTPEVTHLLQSRMRAKTRTAMLLAAYEGLRISEIAKFRGSDINLRAGELRVVGKGGVDAILPLHPMIAAEAEKYGQGWWFPQYKPNSRSQTGGHMLGRSMSGVVSAAMSRAGINGSAHSLRHWFASELLRQGVDIRVIQELMRHASIATTERYLHVDDRQRRAGLLLLPDVTALTSAPELPPHDPAGVIPPQYAMPAAA